MPNEPGPGPGLLASLRRLGDDELVARLRDLAGGERRETARLVAHLAELDTRDLHLRAGYSSLFVYCRDALALAEHDAYNRIEVARAARRFPSVLGLLHDGALNLTTVRLLAPHLTADNHRAVLESARGKRRAEVEEIVARLAPFPEAPTFVRRLPGPRSAPPGANPGPPATGSARPPAPPATGGTAGAPGPTGDLTPLAPDRYRLQVTIDGATVEKLRLAKDLLRHAIPSGDDAAIVDRAFTSLLADLARAKFAATPSPRAAPASAPGSRHVPAEVKRAVFLRDLGRCAFVGTQGRRCGERAFVEFHHRRPYAAGGEATVDNIELRCRRHNGLEARLYFGGSRAGADGAG
jgi:hypothetical protein